MIIIKKIFSFLLGSLMLVTGTNVLAGCNDKDINVCVIGDRVSKEKFINNMFDENIREQLIQKFEDKKVRNIVHTVNYEDYSIKFCISKFTPNDSNREKIKGKVLNSHSIIVIPIDIDKDIKEVKQDMSYMTNYVCEKKNDITQILIVLCSDDFDKYFADDLIGFVCTIQAAGKVFGYGKNKNKYFENQFLNAMCAPSNKSHISYLFDSILDLHKNVFAYKERTWCTCCYLQ